MYRPLALLSLSLLSLAGCNPTRDGGSGSYGYGAPTTENVCTESAAGLFRRPILEVPGAVPVLGIAIDATRGELLLQTERDVRVWGLADGQQRQLRPGSEALFIPFSDTLDWPGTGARLQLDPADGSVALVGAGADGELARLRLSPTGWAVVDAAGRFDAEPGELGLWRWRDGTESLSLRQLADLYYEPALLAKRATGAPLDRADAPSIVRGIGLPPTVSLDVALSADGKEVTGTIEARDRGGCIGALRLFHNGKALPLDQAARTGTAREQRQSFRIAVQPGDQAFQALAVSTRKVEGAPASARIRAPGVSTRPRVLHLLAVGIDRYPNPTLTLDFAVADASGVAGWAGEITRRAGPFAAARVTELYDRDATGPAILAALRELEGVAPEDTVVLYLAGHGENDGEHWFFLPSDFGRQISFDAIRAQGLSSADLRDAVLRIPARRLALIVDACKSGDLQQAFAAATDARYLEWLSRTTGAHVLAATDQVQLAVELPQLGHGAMTHTLLNGLSGAADTDPADRVVTARELLLFSRTALPEVTERLARRAQYPILFTYGADFPLDYAEGPLSGSQ